VALVASYVLGASASTAPTHLLMLEGVPWFADVQERGPIAGIDIR
jgi:hypothetical protein